MAAVGRNVAMFEDKTPWSCAASPLCYLCCGASGCTKGLGFPACTGLPQRFCPILEQNPPSAPGCRKWARGWTGRKCCNQVFQPHRGLRLHSKPVTPVRSATAQQRHLRAELRLRCLSCTVRVQTQPLRRACHSEEHSSPQTARPVAFLGAMVSWIISRLVVIVFGTLYPAYSSYKAVKSRDLKEYVKWMMYWIIFALFSTVEVFTDMFLCWLPFYYELKIAFIVWLLSPYTKGSSVLYRKFVHPTLSSKEKDMDEYIGQTKDKICDTLVHFGRKGLNVAATAAVMAATKGQGVLSDKLRSFSMQDLSAYQSDPAHADPAHTDPATAAPAQQRTKSMMRSKSESYNRASS